MNKKTEELISKAKYKLEICRNIILKCGHPDPDADIKMKILLSYYTDIDEEKIVQLFKNMKRNTFSDLYKKRNKQSHCVFKHNNVRMVLGELYVFKLQIPTKKLLLATFNQMIVQTSGHDNINKLNHELHLHGFVWKRLPHTDKCILVEKREQVLRRLQYLDQMKSGRESNRVAIHIGALVHCVNVLIIVAASPTLGLIDVIVAQTTTDVKSWLRDLLQKVPKKSLFVIQQDLKLCAEKCPTPTIYSSKQHMHEWLNLYNIPYDATVHKSELYALVEKYKFICPPVYNLLDILKADHDVLIRPKELDHMAYFDTVFNDISKKIEGLKKVNEWKANILEYVNNLEPEVWLKQDTFISSLETAMLEEDLRLEFVIESIEENVRRKRSKDILNKLEDYDSHNELYEKIFV